MKKILFLTAMISISACSSTNTIKQLQSEFDHHKYSQYVVDNLKEQPPIVPVQSPDKVTLVKLAKVKHQLSSRKKYASGQINGAVNQNGLYKPSSALQKQIASLGSKNKYENWLRKHSSLNAVLTMALRNNLDIRSAQEQAQASLAKYDQVSYLDDMLSQYAAFTKDIKLSGSTQKHKKSVSSGFPFPGLTALKSSIIDESVKSSRLVLKQVTQDVVTNIRVAYHELQFADQEIVIIRKNTKLLRSLKEDLKNSYSSNTSELSGIVQVDIEIAANRNKLLVAKDNKQAKQARLNALLNLSPEFLLGKLDKLKAEKLKSSLKQLVKEGQLKRVEIARLQTDLKKMEKIIQLSEKRFYPDFDAGFSRFQNGKFTTKPKIKKTNFFAKNDAYLAETRGKYNALKSKIKALKTKTASA